MSEGISRRAAAGGLALIALIPRLAAAAPRARPWPHWRVSDETSTETIDHSAWDAFLARYVVAGVDGIARVAYRRVLPEDREALQLYVATLAGLPITSYSRAQQRPYWINLYNALTLQTVLADYPVDSIIDIGRKRGRGPWGEKLLHIEGEEVSLEDIENRILRPFWRDPRLHYALSLAAMGSPNLAPRAFTAATTDAMLDAGARLFVNAPRGARIRDSRLFVSSIYVWYEVDFGGSDQGVITHLRRYAKPALAAALLHQTKIAGHSFDWSLNDAMLF